MAHCERKTTVPQILLLAVVAAATVSLSRAWPIRITRDATESPVNIADVQRNLKGYVNSLFFVTKDFPLVSSQVNAYIIDSESSTSFLSCMI